MNEILRNEVKHHRYPLLFATVSGAHLYGFPSPDSDYDLRGAHILPAREVLGLDVSNETVTVSGRREGLELDLVTHDIRKYFTLLLRKNGYVLEQLYSPLVVHTTPGHEELKNLAAGRITRYHSHHYLGFAATEWAFFAKESPKHVKHLLYVYRVLLTGIHLMRTGRIEANLIRLNEEFRLPQVPELIARKAEGAEGSILPYDASAFHRSEYERLTRELEAASAASRLPERPTARPGLSDLLVRLRIG